MESESRKQYIFHHQRGLKNNFNDSGKTFFGKDYLIITFKPDISFLFEMAISILGHIKNKHDFNFSLCLFGELEEYKEDDA